MKTSAAGRALITQREGCKLKAYRDPRGIPTIGVGHVDMTPPKATMDMVITPERADELLAADLGQVEAVINAAVEVPLSQNEFDAMASLGFNIGAAGLKRSSVIKRLNLGDVPGAAEAFMAWSKPAVLVGRRKAEAAQFLAPDQAQAGGPAPDLPRARAKALRRAATGARAKAARAQNGAAALVAAGAGTAALAHAHHPHVALVVGLLLVAAGLAAAVIAALAHARAATLAANAARSPSHP